MSSFCHTLTIICSILVNLRPLIYITLTFNFLVQPLNIVELRGPSSKSAKIVLANCATMLESTKLLYKDEQQRRVGINPTPSAYKI